MIRTSRDGLIGSHTLVVLVADHGVRQHIPCHLMDERQVLGADHPQRAAHREMLDEGAPLVERGVEVGDREAGRRAHSDRYGVAGSVACSPTRAATAPSIDPAG